MQTNIPYAANTSAHETHSESINCIQISTEKWDIVENILNKTKLAEVELNHMKCL